MKIYLKNCSEQIKTYYVNEYDSVLQLKELIEKEEHCIVNNQNLRFGSQILQNYCFMNSYGIKNEDTIYLEVIEEEINGEGGFTAFEFLDVSKGLFKNVELGTTGSKRLHVYPGINLNGICDYSNC